MGKTILVCGANGFIGSALCDALGAAGHRVVRGVRQARQADEVSIDYLHDTDAAGWAARLRGVDVVVNAVGILVERGAQRFDRIHADGPIALFDACVAAGVGQVIQISALGAGQGDTAYYRSKRAADAHLLSLPLCGHVLRPALVYGEEGDSARFFRALASAPLQALPGSGRQVLRPIHVDELAEIVVRLVAQDNAAAPAVADLVGGTEIAYRDMLRVYRRAMGFAPAWQVGVPAPLVSLAAALLDHVPGAILTRDTWKMLRAGNTADAAATTALLGRAPAGLETFVDAASAPRLRQAALAAWRPALMRVVLALIWIGSAVCSAFVFPREDSLALLAGVHLHGGWALATLYAASALDLALGIATLAWPGRRLWAAQIGLVLVYTLIVALALPEFLWHPFAPLIKNAAVLAVLVMLLSEEPQS